MSLERCCKALYPSSILGAASSCFSSSDGLWYFCSGARPKNYTAVIPRLAMNGRGQPWPQANAWRQICRGCMVGVSSRSLERRTNCLYS